MTSMNPVVTFVVSELDIWSLASVLSITSSLLYQVNTGAGNPRAVHVRVVWLPSDTVSSSGAGGKIMSAGAT